MKIKIFDKIHWQTDPITNDMVDIDIDEETLNRIGIDKCFDLNTMKVIDYVNPHIEYSELKNWFDVDYMRQEQKLRRLNTLGLMCEDGTRPTDRLIDLYNEAETKRKRIQELEVIINAEQTQMV